MAASQQLQSQICQEIQQQQGWIPFSRYMELALYAPDRGYYSGGATKLGKDGDFTTAPEMTPLFGSTLAAFYASQLPAITPQVMEFGAGSGRLAYDFLTECQLSGIPVERYFIVELSGELAARQEQLLKDFPQVQWLQQMPEAFSGLVLGNEVLDAMPVELVVKRATGWQQLGVALAEPAADGQFVFQERPCEAAWLAQIPAAEQLQDGYLTELHPVAAGFMRSLASMLNNGKAASARGGLAVLLDYGFPAAEYYHPQRHQGTLMCHYRHHAHPDPFYLPGLQDITAHVDFTAMARSALESGAEILAYTSQAGFLLGAGIADLLGRTSAEQVMNYLPQANALQKLVSPAEMGELFKVLVIGSECELPPGLLQQNRLHRL